MKLKLAAFAVVALFVAACDNAATAPNNAESVMAAFDAAASMDSATSVPRGPVVDRELPDSIKLTDAQKAAIKALHDAFAAAHKTQFDQLKAIREEARAAAKAGKTRDEVRTILAKEKPIMDAMKADFDAMRAKIDAILTPAQKAWFAAHQRMGGGPMGGPMMPGRHP